VEKEQHNQTKKEERTKEELKKAKFESAGAEIRAKTLYRPVPVDNYPSGVVSPWNLIACILLCPE